MKVPNSNLTFQRRIAFIGIVLFIGKLIAWKLTNSDAIFSDAMESIVNVVSAFMGLYSLYLAAKPMDKDHPYGHGKVEFVTSALEGFLIVFAGAMILVQSVQSYLKGNPIKQLDEGILIVFATAILNYIMGYYSYRKGVRENSLVLMSSGKHLQSDTYTTFGVVIGLLVVYISKINWIDSVIAFIFGIYIIIIGYQIIRKSLSGIMDEADEELLQKITNTLQTNRIDVWVDVHNMKIVQYGSGLHIDAHLTLPWYLSLKDAHQEMEKAIKVINKEIDRPIEFNFHMDDCKSFSCALCKLNCVHRQNDFQKLIHWDVDSLSQTEKHKLD